MGKVMHYETVADLVRSFPRWGQTPCLSYKTDFRTFRFSYADLYRHIHQDIAILRRNRVKKGDRVIIWGQNSPGWASAFLAIASSGAVAVPLDFRGTAEFAKMVAKEVHPSFAWVGSRMPKVRLSCPIHVLEPLLIFDPEKADVKKAQGRIQRATQSDLLEVVYTSGTTSRPKGVMLTHGNVMSNVAQATASIPINSADVSISLLPLSHMFEQVSNLFGPLSFGSSVVHLERLNRRLIFDALESEHPTFVPIVPRLLELIRHNITMNIQPGKTIRGVVQANMFDALRRISSAFPHPARRLLYPGLARFFPPGVFRFFIAGGAQLDPETERFFDDLGLRILQGYGLTESSPVLAMNSPKLHKIGWVGKPVPGVKIQIAQDGEILAKGPNITTGYYHNPKKTKELFRNSWLATGDLGSFDEDGFLRIYGRKKDMIVTSDGMNVYPEDVEAVLNRLPGVKDSAVVGWPRGGEESVHAVLLLAKGFGSPSTIVAAANSSLPSYARITGYTTWPTSDFPRTTTLKVKKFHVLEYLERQGSREGKVGKTAISTAASNPVYRIIAHVTKQPLSSIKPKANLTADLGLSSLDRVELLAEIEDEYGVSLPDEVISPRTRVADVERLVRMKPVIETALPFRKWVLSRPARLIRDILQHTVLFPTIVWFTQPLVYGYANVKNLQGPSLIVCNHTSHADTPVLLMSLPHQLREQVCPVALLEYFKVKGRHPVKQFFMSMLYEVVCLGAMIIPFPQTSGFGESMRYAGKLVDKGYSILVFPEGERTLDSKIHEFRTGVGLMAVHYKIPVLPVRVRGLFELLPRGAWWPKMSPSSIHFGKPFMVATDNYEEAALEIEKAVREV